MSEHGTTSRYTGGCRCARCRAANAEYQRAYQAARKAGTTRIATSAANFTIVPVQPHPTMAPFTFTVPAPAPPSAEDMEIIRQVRERDAQDTGERIDLDDLVREFGFALNLTLDALVAACVDLRAAFAAYHQAHTQEPA